MKHLPFLLFFIARLAWAPGYGCDEAQLDEVERKWNDFSHTANEYVHTYEIQPAVREAKKTHLGRLWDEVYSLSCF